MIINMVPYFAKDLKFACGIGCPRAVAFEFIFSKWWKKAYLKLEGCGIKTRVVVAHKMQ